MPLYRLISSEENLQQNCSVTFKNVLLISIEYILQNNNNVIFARLFHKNTKFVVKMFLVIEILNKKKAFKSILELRFQDSQTLCFL